MDNFVNNLIYIHMTKDTSYQNKLDFNGEWSLGEANHHVGRKTTQQTHKSKKTYTRKSKHSKDLTIS